MSDTGEPRSLLRCLKASAGAKYELCVPVGTPIVAMLRPVATRANRINTEDVKRLTAWRNRFVSSFLTEFQATDERTIAWLTRMVGPDDTRMLFMVEVPSGQVVGYMGLAFIDWTKASVEADAVVRGEETPRGLMTQCLRHLLGWARDQLGLTSISVRVRSDNSALAFYEKFGFLEVLRTPLMKTEFAGEVTWQPSCGNGECSEISLVHMSLRDDALPDPITPLLPYDYD